MQNIKQISIAEPCHQEWNVMTQTIDGRHCTACSKTVVDFTAMTNQQIIDYLSWAADRTCGRFANHQFDHINRQLKQPAISYWKQMVLITSMLTATIYSKAQIIGTKPKTEQAPSNFILGKVIRTDTVKYRTITGTVTDIADKSLLPGVIVRANGTNITAATNYDGRFQITVPVTTPQITVSYVGYNSQSFIIKDNKNQQLTIELKMQQALMGEVIVVKRASFVKRVYSRFIKRPVKKIFG